MAQPTSIYEQEHEDFRATVRAFMEKEVVPFHDEWEKDGHVSRALETLEPLMSGEVCMEDVRDFLWRVAARLQGQLRVSETRSAQRQDVTQHRSLLRRNIDEGS